MSDINWEEQGDANHYRLMRNGDWLALVQFNGELYESEQEALLNQWTATHHAKQAGSGEAVGRIIDMGDQKFIDMDDETLNSLPVDTKLYTHPSASVPSHDEYHQMAFEIGQPAENGEGYFFDCNDLDKFVAALTTTPQPAPSVPDEVFSEMGTLVNLLRDAAMSEDKVDTCYDEPNKNPRLATALNWLAAWMPTGLKRPNPPAEVK